VLEKVLTIVITFGIIGVFYPLPSKLIGWSSFQLRMFPGMVMIFPENPGSRAVLDSIGIHRWGLRGAIASAFFGSVWLGLHNTSHREIGQCFSPAIRIQRTQLGLRGWELNYQAGRVLVSSGSFFDVVVLLLFPARPGCNLS